MKTLYLSLRLNLWKNSKVEHPQFSSSNVSGPGIGYCVAYLTADEAGEQYTPIEVTDEAYELILTSVARENM